MRLYPGPVVYEALLPRLARSGRLLVWDGQDLDRARAVAWDDGAAWEMRLALEANGGAHALTGVLVRGQERMPLEEPDVLLAAGYLIARGLVARLTCRGSFGWILALRRAGSIPVPAAEREALRSTILALPEPPVVEWPEDLRLAEVHQPPRPALRIDSPGRVSAALSHGHLPATLHFRYDGVSVQAGDPRAALVGSDGRSLYVRDRAAESAALEFLRGLGFRPPSGPDVFGESNHSLELPGARLHAAIESLVDSGWHVETDEAVYRRRGAFQVSVASGIDWFDLEGGVTFGDELVPLPRLLEALAAGAPHVTLSDGARGVLPSDWLSRIAPLVGAGHVQGEALRFRRCQAALLDALLAVEGRATCDEAFARLRERLGAFEGIAPARELPDFHGELRPYQRQGLGWMGFLRELGFGGCLADDMGLGKTVQVLALLQQRRREGAPASLVVVPRSLVFNWRSEAQRFAPELRLVEHHGLARARTAEDLAGAGSDLVLTTYGTLRRDAPFLKDVSFDYVVLDEATAIKNDESATAKAARLLSGRHRLALTGTPVENHLGELWSLMEFLNPGALGRASVFRHCTAGGGRALDEEGARVLSRALRPFIVRRTKAEVAPELPERHEQTIWCELEGEERRHYDELRGHYQRSLLAGLDEYRLRRSKIQVLEALLRLRQAACHRGLIDPSLRDEPGAKLEVLLERVREVAEGGHKALVYSQFTRMLGIVRARLDEAGIPYEYLDGRTRDRAAPVRRFQEDPACPLFLISLKAGGHGLNLTAADHVFLLDPWWNPAVEAQAIDRTHRIGQTRRVFAFRLVARDTVEEKVLTLQAAKRRLAEMVVRADGGLLRELTREDLALLLS